nr:vq motif-containing protein 8, chloroplastic [Quercus suber]
MNTSIASSRLGKWTRALAIRDLDNEGGGSGVGWRPPVAVRPCTTALQQRKQPVIIYTHSPKIIHTKAQDFMALVQKLTGMSQPNDDDQTQKSEKRLSAKGNDRKVIKPFGHDDRNDSSSALTEENCGDVKARSSSLSPIFNQTNPYFADIPLFTPSSNNFFCSPRPVYRYPDSAFVSPNIGNSMSPSVLEFIKGLPEY